MTFTQVDDAWPDSPDVLAVSRSARLLEVEGKCYCNRHLTDGRITRSQWLRATDTETFAAEVLELIGAGLAEELEPGVYQLDWSQQQTREQVLAARARKKADNDRRAKSLELHKVGDHSLCTHEGGGRSRGRGTPGSSGQSRGRSISTSTSKSDGKSSGLSLVGSPTTPTPTHPTPTHSETEGGVGGRVAGASAGATAHASAGEGPVRDRPTYAHPQGEPPKPVTIDGVRYKPRLHPDGSWVSADWLGFGPWDVGERVFISAVQAKRDDPDPDDATDADALDGLIPAGGADG